MKSTRTVFLFLTFKMAVASASVMNLNGTAMSDVTDETGSLLDGDEMSFVLVDLDGLGFGVETSGLIGDGASLAVGDLIQGDLILGTNSTSTTFGSSQVSGNTSSFESTDAFGTGHNIEGDSFGVVWFTELTFPSSTAEDPDGTGPQVDHYGFHSDPSWVIPSSPGQQNFGGTVFDTVSTEFQADTGTVEVTAIPEPSPTLVLAALGFGGLLVSRRRLP